MQVKLFKALVEDDPMRELCLHLVQNGFKIYEQAEPADCSIVISGRYENPLSLTGKKILIFNENEWASQFWGVFEPIVKEYYDELVDITGRTLDQATQIIRNCYDYNAREDNQQGSQDRDNKLL